MIKNKFLNKKKSQLYLRNFSEKLIVFPPKATESEILSFVQEKEIAKHTHVPDFCPYSLIPRLMQILISNKSIRISSQP